MLKKMSGFCEWRRALRLFSDPGGRYKRAVTMRAARRRRWQMGNFRCSGGRAAWRGKQQWEWF